MRRAQLIDLITEYAATRGRDAGAEPTLTLLIGGPFVDAAPEILRLVLAVELQRDFRRRMGTPAEFRAAVENGAPPADRLREAAALNVDVEEALTAFWRRATAGEPDVEVTIPAAFTRPSSNIESVGYHAETQTLQVIFKNGGAYRYGGVTPEEAAPALARESSESLGQYIVRAFVRRADAHPFVKMVPVGDPVQGALAPEEA